MVISRFGLWMLEISVRGERGGDIERGEILEIKRFRKMVF